MEELAFSEGDGAWAVSAEIEGMLGLATLGTGIDPPAGEDSAPSRICRIDREAVSSAAAFADHLRVVWLVPAMDPLFNGPASARRRFLDRLVLAHAGLIRDMTGFAPLLLLDEIIAHLDPTRRAALYDALANLGAQVWMTGADPAAFGDIVGRAQVFEVRSGAVEPHR